MQQYLPPALMLEQLRNERYRQTAQGLQQGITGALQAYMNMEQLKQAAAEKKAARKERARQFDITEQRLKAIQEGQLGVDQGGLAVRQSEADRLIAKQKAERADVLREQILQDLRQTAKGIRKGEGALAGVDTQTAKEFMEAGLPGFGKRRQALPAMQALPQMQGEMPMRVRDAGTPPATARQIFAATPEGGTEQEKTARLMNALIGGMDAQSIRTAAPQEDVIGARISPEAKQLGPRDVSRSTGEMELLFKNLEELAAEQQARPEAFALTETARKIGYKGPYKQARGLYAEEEERREARDLGLDKLRQDIASGKALETKRLRGRGVGRGAGRGKPLVSAEVLEKALSSQLKTIDAEGNQLEPMVAVIKNLRSYKKDATGAEIPPSAADIAKADAIEQEYAAAKAALQERRDRAVNDFREALRRLGEGKIDVYDTMAVQQAQAPQPTDVGVPEMLARPSEQQATQQSVVPSGIMGSKDEILQETREAMQDAERVTPKQLNDWLNMQDAKGMWGQSEIKEAQEIMAELKGEGLSREQIAAVVGRRLIKQPGFLQQIKSNPYGRAIIDLFPKPPKPNYGTGMTMAE